MLSKLILMGHSPSLQEIEEALVAVNEVVSCLDSAAGTGSSFCRDSPAPSAAAADSEASSGSGGGRLLPTSECSSLSTSADHAINSSNETGCPTEKIEPRPMELPDSSRRTARGEDESDRAGDGLLEVEEGPWDHHQQQQPSREKLVVYDLCSGKGFFSLLLSSLAPLLPVLAAAVSEVVMVDKNSGTHNPIGLAHVGAANRTPDCLPIRFVQANLHDKQLPLRLGMQPATRSVASMRFPHHSWSLGSIHQARS